MNNIALDQAKKTKIPKEFCFPDDIYTYILKGIASAMEKPTRPSGASKPSALFKIYRRNFRQAIRNLTLEEMPISQDRRQSFLTGVAAASACFYVTGLRKHTLNHAPFVANLIGLFDIVLTQNEKDEKRAEVIDALKRLPETVAHNYIVPEYTTAEWPVTRQLQHAASNGEAAPKLQQG